MQLRHLLLIAGLILSCVAAARAAGPATRKTAASIEAGHFVINGEPTYKGREWNGVKVEGLLLNARLVQGIFDDANPQTRGRWKYPDTDKWDPDRNTREFVDAMPAWRKCGLLAFTINLQGGSPEGYSRAGQPWVNSAFRPDGSLDAAYLARLETILDRADELGMVAIVGFFYGAQVGHVENAEALDKAVDNATDWLTQKRYTNVLVEIANEADGIRTFELNKPQRQAQLIERVQKRSAGKLPSPAGRLLVSVSMLGGKLPSQEVARSADFLLLHGNGVGSGDEIARMVRSTAALPGARGKPVVFNEDDHPNNFAPAIRAGASWGFFDYRRNGEGFDEGFQSVPVNWRISSKRKRDFFRLVAEISGGEVPRD